MAKWPEFVTRDLGNSAAASDEMQRRWEVYDREMKTLIALGGVHQDEDGWWVDDASGELIGPDPEIERPRTSEELARFRPIDEVMPEFAEELRRSRGRPRLANAKQPVTLRLDPDVVEKFKSQGDDWRTRMAQILKDAS
ncbi:MAG: BrnA antitoxin family protein [Candidatus Devosia phytovorans]|uniref:BrnA antitoxin family protein n=1 Tax=Candidatus Devosia phytovorans TaxID=3121372 RepID=A0AAJ6B0P4_9HYPH|nr:BrnA antitoxin family protein [Devosia sp.]WEK05422.1 MAG: BrnA antitoxin family protein [Devosia sp.]